MDAHTVAEMIYRRIELVARSEEDPVNLSILADAVANMYYGPRGHANPNLCMNPLLGKESPT